MYPLEWPNAPAAGPINHFLIAQVSAIELDHTSLRAILRDSYWDLHHLRTYRQAREWLFSHRAAAVITDSRLPDGCWKDILGLLLECSSPSNLIVSSRLADERLWAEVLNLGGYDLLVTPFEAKELFHVLSMACQESHFSIPAQPTQVLPAVRVAGAD